MESKAHAGEEMDMCPFLAACMTVRLVENNRAVGAKGGIKKGRRGRPFDSLSNLKAEGLYLRFKFWGAVLHLNLRGAVLTTVGIGATLGREATDTLLLG